MATRFQVGPAVIENIRFQIKLEAQYAAKRDAHIHELADLKQQLEMKSNEVRSLNASIDSLKSVNEELKVIYFIVAPRLSLSFSDAISIFFPFTTTNSVHLP